MKYCDFTTLLDGEPPGLALLSTFNFEPPFFERRLLRCPALAKSRRIAVFMDAGQWQSLQRSDTPARWINRRYLVVPVRRAKGVFHPKLHLLASAGGCQLLCGSGNLTRAGCTHNLELVNSISISPDEQGGEDRRPLLNSALVFFQQAASNGGEDAGRIAKMWLDEWVGASEWLRSKGPTSPQPPIRLLHTYDKPIWEQLVRLLGSESPKKVFVMSPFFDPGGDLIRRVRSTWPRCELEIVAQQRTSNLPTKAILGLRSGVGLSEIRNSSRRLHAKLVAWSTRAGWSCLVGSANFTTAAFDGHNVETCLLVSACQEYLDDLFDSQLPKKRIAVEDFDPGSETEPADAPEDETQLRVDSALLAADDTLHVAYQHCLPEPPKKLSVALRVPGERLPRAMLPVPKKTEVSTTITVPAQTLADVHGSLLVSLIADLAGGRRESLPVWAIQEERLTYEPSDGSSRDTRRIVEERGENLPEYLEELGKRDGPSSVIEFLRHLNIRFHDGDGSSRGTTPFHLRRSDPFQPDTHPDWLLGAHEQADDLENAIYDFVDRHERQRLRKHSERGNINGMENFLDIYTAMIRVLYIYCARGVVKKPQLVGRVCKYIELATAGIDEGDDHCPGYLVSLAQNLRGSQGLLLERCTELNFLGHVHAALLIAQMVRFDPEERPSDGPAPTRPSECLVRVVMHLKKALASLRVPATLPHDVWRALDQYRMIPKDDERIWRHQLGLPAEPSQQSS